VPHVESTFPQTNHLLLAMLSVAEADFRAHVAVCPECSGTIVSALMNCAEGWELLLRLANVRSACLPAPEEANVRSSH
jgi:hypothetical protein